MVLSRLEVHISYKLRLKGIQEEMTLHSLTHLNFTHFGMEFGLPMCYLRSKLLSRENVMIAYQHAQSCLKGRF